MLFVLPAVEINGFDPYPVDDPEDETTTLRINVEASARFAIKPSIYVGLFADGWMAVQAYAKATPMLEIQGNFKFRTNSSEIVPLPPLTSSWCANALVGCVPACLKNHDVRLDAAVALRVTAGYVLYVKLDIILFPTFTLGSEELRPINVSHLDVHRDIGAWCHYLFPAPFPPPPPSGEYYRVAFEGGLQVGGDSGPPVLGVRGRIVSDGVSWLELATVEEWRPLGDMLPMPKLNGTARFYPDGAVTVDVTASLSRSVVIPSLLEFRDMYMYVSVASFKAKDTEDTEDINDPWWAWADTELDPGFQFFVPSMKQACTLTLTPSHKRAHRSIAE